MWDAVVPLVLEAFRRMNPLAENAMFDPEGNVFSPKPKANGNVVEAEPSSVVENDRAVPVPTMELNVVVSTDRV